MQGWVDKKATRYRVEVVYIKEITVIYHHLRSMTMDIFLCIFGGFAPADSSKDEREDGQGERNWGKKETGMSRQYDAVYRYIKSAFPQRKYI